MPYAAAKGARLYYEEAGRGTPIVFVHEFSGDLRSWEAQMRHFSRRYRCVAFNARGYPPSDVPAAVSNYSWRIAVDDIAAVMRHLKLRRAHIVGCSMGAYATLQFGLMHPRRALSLTAVSAGAGSSPDPKISARFVQASAATARSLLAEGLGPTMDKYRNASNRIQLERKDPGRFREFFVRFAQHSALGHANTLRGVQMRRPPIHALGRKLKALKVPTHVIVGDEDGGSVEPGLFIQRTCPAARLSVVAATGHVVNVEEPRLFNTLVGDFLALVDSGRWRPRDPRACQPS